MTIHGFTGNLLLRTGVVDAAGLARAVDVQRAQNCTLGRALASLGLTDESVVAQTLAAALHLEAMAGDPPEVDIEVAALLPAEFCRKRGVVPLTLDGKLLRLAVTDPMDDAVLQDVRFKTGRKTAAVVVTETQFQRLCAAVYPEAEKAARTFDMLDTAMPTGELESAIAEDDVIDPAALAKDIKLPPIVRLVNLILSDAAGAGASDVHVEPQQNALQVRQRVDGLLRDVLTIPRNLQDQTISRLKIISGMDISERRKPQDGRSRLRWEGRTIDLRVSTLPTQFGEKIVIRLLNSDRAVMPINEIGFLPENLRLMRSFISRPQGMILVTGPTGSGKTSTLYTSLNSITSSSNNIVTLEDPIEVQLAGVNQMQINAKAGVTFASGLRSILRQDPNVILVGEIRDQETAEIALQAAMTGHLLLSTLHTNDAPSTVTRLFDLGIPPFLVASSLVGIVAQRLVRRPCPSCAVPQHPSAEAIDKAGGMARLPADAKWMAGKGCEHCGGLGVKGRMAIHEVLEVNEEVRELISLRASEQAIRRAARRAGMRTLFEDGVAKAAQGLTTLGDVLRVVSRDENSEESGPPRLSHATPEAAPAAPVADTLPEPKDVGQKRVLVVEDSPTIASVVKYFLELEGFEVLMAADGLIGLDMALREIPDVIVSDVNMPGMTGIAMVRALRAEPLMTEVRVLMLTSESSIEAETEGLAAGADDYILKPVEPRRLAARVQSLLARSRVRAA
jgi:type IV pilus assembly protein PilB